MSATPHQLLCESCGYPLDGIDPARACPECGKPVAESLPERRAGSPWQQRPAPGAWFSTACLIATQPRGAWSKVRVERARAASLAIVNITASAALGTLAMVSGPAWSSSLRYSIAYFIASFFLLLALTAVEYVGIRFLGSRHGFRVTSHVAIAVCGHASFGWLVSGAGIAIGAQIMQRIPALWNVSMGLRGGANIGVLIFGAVLLGLFAVGMIAYSVLCGIGYRAMRYANA